MTAITTLSCAKLNLFLHITGKRDDGYHDLQTVFRLLDWGDEMRFEVIESLWEEALTAPIRLWCDTHLTDDPMDNLIVKSAYALIDYTKVEKPLPIIDIYLEKQIPTGAGLGGGSSNAATTLMVLNELWELGLTAAELQQIGATLGADVPFFIYAQNTAAKKTSSAIGEGIGEVLTPIDIPKQQYLLLTPSAHISTPKLFAHPNLQRNLPKLSTCGISEKQTDFVHQLKPPFSNVFQPIVCELSEEVCNALAYLQMFEPITHTTARMTGSGSSVFIPIPFDITNDLIEMWIKNAPCNAYLVQSL